MRMLHKYYFLEVENYKQKKYTCGIDNWNKVKAIIFSKGSVTSDASENKERRYVHTVWWGVNIHQDDISVTPLSFTSVKNLNWNGHVHFQNFFLSMIRLLRVVKFSTFSVITELRSSRLWYKEKMCGVIPLNHHIFCGLSYFKD